MWNVQYIITTDHYNFLNTCIIITTFKKQTDNVMGNTKFSLQMCFIHKDQFRRKETYSLKSVIDIKKKNNKFTINMK